MADDVFGFIADDVDRIRNVVSFVEKSPRYTPDTKRRYGGPMSVNGIVEGTLTSAVTAASPDGKTGATTFTIRLWYLDDTDTHDPQYLSVSTDDTAGVNTTNRTATSGTHAFCAYMNGRLQFLFGDCP